MRSLQRLERIGIILHNSIYLFMCKTFAGGNPLKKVDDA